MRGTRFSIPHVLALVLAGGCATSNTPTPEPSAERILAVDASGKVLRQSTSDEHTRVMFPAPMDKVWRALVASYADAGIDPTLSDPASGRYGSAAFLVPRRMMATRSQMASMRPIW